MKRLTILFMMGTIMFSAIPANAASCTTEITTFFKGYSGCFLLYNLTKDTYDMTYGGAACEKPLSPASTFKIPNSLIGLDLGIVKDENTLFHWDGSKQFLKTHEHDHTLATAVRDSVVWVFQNLAKHVGEPAYHDYLKRFLKCKCLAFE